MYLENGFTLELLTRKIIINIEIMIFRRGVLPLHFILTSSAQIQLEDEWTCSICIFLYNKI